MQNSSWLPLPSSLYPPHTSAQEGSFYSLYLPGYLQQSYLKEKYSVTSRIENKSNAPPCKLANPNAQSKHFIDGTLESRLIGYQ